MDTDSDVYRLLVDAMTLITSLQTRLDPSLGAPNQSDDDMLTDAEMLLARWERLQESIE